MFSLRALRGLAPAAALFSASYPAVCSADAQGKPEPQIRKFTNLKVTDIKEETPDVRRVTFALPDSSKPLGHNPISAVMLKTLVPGIEKPTMKPYNPVLNKRGEFSLFVKKYDNAKMGGAVHSLQVGDEMAAKFGWQQWAYEPNEFAEIGLIAGGTGLTPMLQLIQAIMNDPSDTTKVTLILANKSVQDVIYKEELDALSGTHPSKLRVVHVLEEAPDEFWGMKGYQSPNPSTGQTGRITVESLRTLLPAPADNIKVLVCGKSGMVKAIAGPKIFEKGKAPQQGPLLGMLKELGYSEQHVFKV